MLAASKMASRVNRHELNSGPNPFPSFCHKDKVRDWLSHRRYTMSQYEAVSAIAAATVDHRSHRLSVSLATTNSRISPRMKTTIIHNRISPFRTFHSQDSQWFSMNATATSQQYKTASASKAAYTSRSIRWWAPSLDCSASVAILPRWNHLSSPMVFPRRGANSLLIF